MSDYAAALRDELMTATRRRPRRGPVAVGVGALVAIVVAVLALAGSGSQPAAADVDITHRDGRVFVTLTDRETTPAAIEAATDKEGLDIHVREVATGPSAVGRFVNDSQSQGGGRVQLGTQEDGVSSVQFSVPQGWKGTLTVGLGREAHGDEDYGAPTNALAAGEPLACATDVLGEPLSDVADRLRDRAVTVQDPLAGSDVPMADALEHGLGDSPVTGAKSLSPSRVLVLINNSIGRPPDGPPC